MTPPMRPNYCGTEVDCGCCREGEILCSRQPREVLDLSGVPGQVLGHNLPEWPADCTTFGERRAYQRGVAHARYVDKVMHGPAVERALRAFADELKQLCTACYRNGGSGEEELNIDEMLARHIQYPTAAPPLCEDEGCPQHGTPHVCVTGDNSSANNEPTLVDPDYPWTYSVPERTDADVLLLTVGDTLTRGTWKGELGEFFKAWCKMPKRDKVLEEKLGLLHSARYPGSQR